MARVSISFHVAVSQSLIDALLPPATAEIEPPRSNCICHTSEGGASRVAIVALASLYQNLISPSGKCPKQSIDYQLFATWKYLHLHWCDPDDDGGSGSGFLQGNQVIHNSNIYADKHFQQCTSRNTSGTMVSSIHLTESNCESLKHNRHSLAKGQLHKSFTQAARYPKTSHEASSMVCNAFSVAACSITTQPKSRLSLVKKMTELVLEVQFQCLNPEVNSKN
ncbi:hypothetical protein VitviT2T_021813 [Vitis vinifera]|uniref:Uncharacterized protein n=1 Tax=Vitis vinifera TaxID=29760 RepID=A0ABY9DAU5_VITVI|nr:hypothetical protein VitviT2T_021813 [Vitis vinifera]